MMKSVCVVALFGLGILAFQSVAASPATTHEQAIGANNLSDATIPGNSASEADSVKTMLMQYHALAVQHLNAAAEAKGALQAEELEAAATQVANIANEGDKQVQALRQRDAKAGHNHNNNHTHANHVHYNHANHAHHNDANHAHHNDAEPKGNYTFVDSKEKRQLLTLAGKIAKLGASAASSTDIKAVSSELDDCFAKAIAAE